jgi:Raf kinase inhibitor-like YbhB/YbcL family protein
MPGFNTVQNRRLRMRKPSLLLVSCAAVVLLRGVASSDAPTAGPAAEPASLQITSDAFADGKMIPRDHTCDGADRSPPLHWDGAPERTKALALVVDDPDAPSGVFTHWLLYNVPAAAKALDEGVATKGTLGDGSRQGTNDFGQVGWKGPCPPPGSTHRYFFKLYALSAPLELEPGAKRDAVEKAIKEKKLAEAQLKGRYERPSKGVK